MLSKTEEAPRDFGVFVARLQDGAALSELSGELQRIVGLTREEAEARREKVTGVLTFKVAIQIDPEGHADVTYDITVKEPKKERPASLFFLTRGDNLSDEMTKQTRLPIRDVSTPSKARSIDDSDDVAREVP